MLKQRLLSGLIIYCTHIAASPAPLTTFQAINTSYTNRPDLKKIYHDIRASERLQKAALSGYLPQINVEAGAGSASGLNFFVPRRYATLYFTQLIYAPAGPIQLYRIAKQDTKILEWQEQIKLNESRFQSESGILDLWIKQQGQVANNAYDTISKIIIEQKNHEFNLGLLDRENWMERQSDYSQAQGRVSKYIDDISIASINLERALGITCSNQTLVDDSSIDKLINEAFSCKQLQSPTIYLQDAIQHRQELCMADETITKELYWQRFYCKSYFPSLSLYANVIRYTYNGKLLGGAFAGLACGGRLPTGWNAGIKLDWQFDGLENVFNQSASGERYFAAMMDRIDTLQKIKNEVYNNHTSLKKSFEDFAVAHMNYKKAENDIILKRKEFEVGLISPVSFQLEEALWTKAQQDYRLSKIQVAKNYRTLLYSCGYPDKDNAIAHKLTESFGHACFKPDKLSTYNRQSVN